MELHGSFFGYSGAFGEVGICLINSLFLSLVDAGYENTCGKAKNIGNTSQLTVCMECRKRTLHFLDFVGKL